MAKKVEIGLDGFVRSEEVHVSGKVYVAMAWWATDGSGSTIRRTTGAHDTYDAAYAEAKQLLKIAAEDAVSDKFGDWPS